MRRQHGQSALEFALVAPMMLFMILTAIYGGAMFIQFMNYSNEARRIARDIAVTDVSKREALIDKYEKAYTETNTRVGMYQMTLTIELWKTVEETVGETTVEKPFQIKDKSDYPNAKEVRVIFNFDLSGREFFFDFPPKNFASSYHMQLEN